LKFILIRLSPLFTGLFINKRKVAGFTFIYFSLSDYLLPVIMMA